MHVLDRMSTSPKWQEMIKNLKMVVTGRILRYLLQFYGFQSRLTFLQASTFGSIVSKPYSRHNAMWALESKTAWLCSVTCLELHVCTYTYCFSHKQCNTQHICFFSKYIGHWYHCNVYVFASHCHISLHIYKQILIFAHYSTIMLNAVKSMPGQCTREQTPVKCEKIVKIKSVWKGLENMLAIMVMSRCVTYFSSDTHITI